MTPGPTTCDNAKAKEVGQYDPTKTNRPPPTPTDGGGGGGGDYGGGGSYYYCTPYYWVLYYYDGGPWQEVERWYAGFW